MAEAYEVEIGGQVYEVEADTPQQAATYARLLAAREQGTAQAMAGAEARSNAGRGELAFMPGQRGAPTSVPVSGPEDLAELESGKRLGATTAGMAGMTALTGPGMLANPMAAVAGLAKSAAGGIAGGEVGGRLGGMFGLGEPGKAIGATVGGLAGPFVSPAKLMKAFGLGGGRGGALGSVLERLAGTQAPSAEAASVAAKKLELEAAKLAEKKLAREAATAARDRALKLAEERNALLRMRLESKAAPKAPKPRAVETEAAAPTSAAPVARNQAATALKPMAEPARAEILPEGRRAPATNLGGKAKPRPSPTPPEELEATLRKSLDAIIAKKAAASPLQGPRIQVGAQRVGRQVGMTKEEVRRQAGPVLDETLGEASPILPKEPFQKIIDTMRQIPIAEREAYVARATSGKAKWQIENIRRTLEHLGLLMPVGLAGIMAAGQGGE